MKQWSRTFVLSLFVLVSSVAYAQSPVFTSVDGVDQPVEWTTSVSDNVKDNDVLRLSSSEATTEWRSNKITFTPRKLYRYSFRMCETGDGSGGCACNGVDFFNIDYSGVPRGDRPTVKFSETFFTPDVQNESSARFAKWNARREFRIADAKFQPARPLFRLLKNKQGNVLALGSGETLDEDGSYRFSCFSSFEPSNYDRPLFSTTSHFNSDRWDMGRNDNVVYRFSLEPYAIDGETLRSAPSIPFTSGTINVRVGYYQAGTLAVEYSRNGTEWSQIGKITNLGSEDFSLDEALHDNPTEFYIRLIGKSVEKDGPCHLQADKLIVNLSTKQDEQTRFIGRGETVFSVTDASSLDPNAPNAELWGVDDDDKLWAIENDANKILKFEWDSHEVVKQSRNPSESLNVGPEQRDYVVKLRRPEFLTVLAYPFFEQNYTKLIQGGEIVDQTNSGLDASWCEADYNVPRNPKSRKLGAARPIVISSAKNDFESFQVILHTDKSPLRDIKVALADDLHSENGSVIPRDNVLLRRTIYHKVVEPTDSSCAAGWYPDALVPFAQNATKERITANVEPRSNLSIWVTVKVEADVTSGEYEGTVIITANEEQTRVVCPFKLVVYDFTLPVSNTLETAYGLSFSNIDRYHNLKTEQDKRIVYEKYLQLYSDYRISPYDPTPLDPIRVEWITDSNPPRCELDFSAFSKEIKRTLDKFHFTNFRLPFQGLGGGTYQSRYNGSIKGFSSDTPEYATLLSDYGRKLETELEKLGVLENAYIYNFDEPEEKDYEFVAGEFAKLKKYAPKITRMLTEEPSETFDKILESQNASIDVWCPVSPNYSRESASVEREKGSRFWWYVCCFPKAPYCTEFIDHPLQELRLWHWQTYERDIKGCLVWSGNYWNSPTAFPDSFQNPYDDPESYVTDGAIPAGTRVPWGNGDGRFIYPPVTAPVPGCNDGQPIYDAPCASERFEMIREGVEDYETLVILKRLLDEKKDLLTNEEKERYENLFDFSEITSDTTHFSKDPQVLLARRLEIMNAIVDLNKKTK